MKGLKDLWEDIFTEEVCQKVLVKSLNRLTEFHEIMSDKKVSLNTDLQSLEQIVKDLRANESKLRFDCGFVNFYVSKGDLKYFKNYLECFGISYEDCVSYENYYGFIILNWSTQDLPDNKYGKLLASLSRVQSVTYKNAVYSELLPYINERLDSDDLIGVNTVMD